MRHAMIAMSILLALEAVLASEPSQRTLTFEDRVTAQKAIEQVYWRHRVWPKENPTSKPALSAVLPDGAIRAKVEDYLKKSNVLDRDWRRPITGGQLQRELDRMARDSNDRRVLRELFDALGNDPFVIAETLARPLLADRLVRTWHQGDAALHDAGESETFDAWWGRRRTALVADPSSTSGVYALPIVGPQSCARDTWSLTHVDVPEGRVDHFAVWTGSEMIVWGGLGSTGYLVTGGRYDPATDTWTAMSLEGEIPSRHRYGTVVWTGTEMIVWGGWSLESTISNTGARYNPATDVWRATSVGADVPEARNSHTTVWTGSEMIVWGGQTTAPGTTTGGRYNPVSDSWLATSTGPNTPAPRTAHTAVWTGSEMVIWGGRLSSGGSQTGARYNPSTDSWIPVSVDGAPASRNAHAAVWTGTEMIVWGGVSYETGVKLKSGGRYSPASDSWLSTSTVNAPTGGAGYFAFWTGSRMLAWNGTGAGYDPSSDTWTGMAGTTHPAAFGRTAVWTGEEMIAWGGSDSGYLNSGARYRPSTDSWVPTSNASTVPVPRAGAPSVWTGAEMIVWGGYVLSQSPSAPTNTGGRYSPATDSWLPTSTAPEVPTPRIQPTAVWTGREMLVWGGSDSSTGGRYDPMTDTWNATATGTNVPGGRSFHTAVWTGTEMIVWGGFGGVPCGGRYDPESDSWLPMSTLNEPWCANSHAAVWTGTEMIVWGGIGTATGGRYDPKSDTWNATSMVNVPSARYDFAAVWTGHEMIVWGGHGSGSGVTLNSGGHYEPVTDTWSATSTAANVPPPCDFPVSVWTGLEMVVFHQCGPDNDHSSVGARYDPAADAWLPMTSWPLLTTYLFRGSTVWTGDRMLIWAGTSAETGASYCACPRLHTVYRDVDGDGFGDGAVSLTTCDDPTPAGYAEDSTDCSDADPATYPGAVESCDGFDNNCDGAIDEDVSGVDSDVDGVHNACDNCAIVWNPSQTDSNNDGQGDTCDLDDGLIYIYSTDRDYREWQAESGYTTWNSYRGSLAVLRATGQYTQVPGSNTLATRNCGLADPYVFDVTEPSPGDVAFNLVTGVAAGVESSLGTNSAGAPRPNANPCP